MNVLVLGGTGPTGPTIVNGLLERGHEVVIMHSGEHEVEFAQPIEHIHGEVHFEETLTEALGDRKFDMCLAMYGRLRVTAEVMVGKVDRFVSVGGGSGGWFDSDRAEAASGILFGPEDPDPVRDRFYYEIWRSEQVVMGHHHAGHYHAAHIRYPILYGPRNPGSKEWSIVRRILDGRKQIIMGDSGMKLESKCYTDNAAHAILLAIDNPDKSGGKVLTVADERVLTLRERAELMAKALGQEIEFIDMPFDWAKPFGAYARGQMHRVIDISKIKNELGYRDVISAVDATMYIARWLAENRPEPGGIIEQQLGDHFDYEKEDALIEATRAYRKACEAIGHPDHVEVHPYRHPKKPNEGWRPPEQWRGFRLI